MVPFVSKGAHILLIKRDIMLLTTDSRSSLSVSLDSMFFNEALEYREDTISNIL